MKIPIFIKFIFLFIIISVPIIYFLPYFRLQRDDREEIIENYKFVPAYNLHFTAPVDIEVFPNSTDLIIVEQRGIIQRIIHGLSNNSSEVFLDISDRVSSGGEMGLLSMVFHPNFENNGYFYVDYTKNEPRRTIISRYTYNLTQGNAESESEKIILEVEQPAANHNGGELLFGLDGYLYISLGDGGGANDIYRNAQNRGTLLGSILRINIDVPSEQDYAIPLDNPYIGNTNGYREEIFAYGLRNPWRMSQDPLTERIWVGDAGQNLYEEVDIIEFGKNYGWNEMEGFHCFQLECDKSAYEPPIVEYDHTDGIAITGGHVYRGSKFPEFVGRYFFGDYGFGNVWTINAELINDSDMSLLLKQNIAISSFGLDANGEILLCGLGGQIYELVKSNE